MLGSVFAGAFALSMYVSEQKPYRNYGPRRRDLLIGMIGASTLHRPRSGTTLTEGYVLHTIFNTLAVQTY